MSDEADPSQPEVATLAADGAGLTTIAGQNTLPAAAQAQLKTAWWLLGLSFGAGLITLWTLVGLTLADKASFEAKDIAVAWAPFTPFVGTALAFILRDAWGR